MAAPLLMSLVTFHQPLPEVSSNVLVAVLKLFVTWKNIGYM